MRQQRDFVNDQGGAVFGYGLRLGVGSEPDDRQMTRGRVLFQASDGGQGCGTIRVQIDQHQHRPGLLGALDQERRGIDDLNPIIEVLQPVH